MAVQTSWSLAALVLVGCSPALDSSNDDLQSAATAGSVVISQLYGGGGNSGAPYANDYLELFNRNATAVSLTGWSVQYASATGSSWTKANLSGTIAAGGYYLVELASGGAGGAKLPAPDATGTANLSGTSGTLALVADQTALACGGSKACLPNANIIDFVGYGAAEQFDGAGPAPAPSTTTAGFRADHGCTDTGDNAADFATAAPAPRNSATAPAPCSSGATDAGIAVDAPVRHDAREPIDAAVHVDAAEPIDAASGGSGDGSAERLPCTNSLGKGMTAAFGRLDGYLVSIVQPGTSTCNGDANHMHLQIQMSGAVYDIAVDVDSTSGGSSDVSFLPLFAPPTARGPRAGTRATSSTTWRTSTSTRRSSPRSRSRR